MKYVIIGTGNISNTYVNAISEIHGSEVVACVSKSDSKLSSAPSIPSFSNLEGISIDFDAVIVATPNGLHCKGIVAAAKNGKHVITEKPLGIDIAEMNNAVQLCENNKVTLAVAYQHRTSPDNIAVKKLIDESTLGKVFAVDLAAKFYRDQAYYDSAEYRGGFSIDGGGPFMQQACHNIDIYVWFFGKPIKVVSMLDAFTHDIEAEDHGAALLRHENGMIGTIIASTATKPGYAARLEIHSEKGSLTMIDGSITQWDFKDIPNPSSSDFNYKHDGATSASVSDTSAHKEIIKDFEEAVKNGSQPIANAQSAKATSELILEIYNSAI